MNYADIEDGIKTRLTAATPKVDPETEDTPSVLASRNVIVGLGGMSRQELIDELARHQDAASTPAALIYYAGSESDGKREVKDVATFWIIVIASGRSRDNATRDTAGIYGLLDFVRGRLHNYMDGTDLVNELVWAGNEPFVGPDIPPSVAAYMAKFTATVWWM